MSKQADLLEMISADENLHAWLGAVGWFDGRVLKQ